jgi:hypothetical protein
MSTGVRKLISRLTYDTPRINFDITVMMKKKKKEKKRASRPVTSSLKGNAPRSPLDERVPPFPIPEFVILQNLRIDWT